MDIFVTQLHPLLPFQPYNYLIKSLELFSSPSLPPPSHHLVSGEEKEPDKGKVKAEHISSSLEHMCLFFLFHLGCGVHSQAMIAMAVAGQV